MTAGASGSRFCESTRWDQRSEYRIEWYCYIHPYLVAWTVHIQSGGIARQKCSYYSEQDAPQGCSERSANDRPASNAVHVGRSQRDGQELSNGATDINIHLCQSVYSRTMWKEQGLGQDRTWRQGINEFDENGRGFLRRLQTGESWIDEVYYYYCYYLTRSSNTTIPSRPLLLLMGPIAEGKVFQDSTRAGQLESSGSD